MEENIGEKILIQRRRKNLTQKELANLIGVSMSTVSKWEQCISKPSALSTLRLNELLFKESNQVKCCREKKLDKRQLKIFEEAS